MAAFSSHTALLPFMEVIHHSDCISAWDTHKKREDSDAVCTVPLMTLQHNHHRCAVGGPFMQQPATALF